MENKPFKHSPERQTETVETLHCIASFDRKRGLYAFFCECQPLMTLLNHGLPTRCPICGAENPLREETHDYFEKQQG
jgi:hypothetical protein